jgi:asparagine synthase (glutamine-hydrolysing)
MRSVMRHHSWYVDQSYSDPSGLFACGKIALAAPLAEPFRPIHQSAIVMLDGDIYDYADHRRELEAEGLSFVTADHAELLAHGLRRWGHAFLNRIEGYFSAAIWQPADQTLLLTNDRFGMKPLYCADVKDGFVFASEIKALLQHPGVPRRRSMKGIAQFFTYGHFLGNDTLFESIRTVPAAAIVTYDAHGGASSTERYWRLKASPIIADEREALATVDDAFGRAVARRITGPAQVGLSLSGGLDARTILAAMPKGSARVKSVSVGIAGSIDHRAASTLAMLAGAEHYCQFLADDFLSQFPFHLRKLVFLTDGHYLDQAITVPTLGTYRQLGIEMLLRGHAGELLHMDKAYAFSIRPDELRFGDSAALERWLWSHLTAYMIGGIGHDMFRQELRDEAAALARHSLTDAVAQSHGFVPTEQRLWHLFVQERLRRETAMSMQIFNSVVDIRLPYVDTAFIEATMQVRPNLKMGDTIQSFMLQRRFPPFLNVVNANTGTMPGAGAMRKQMGVMRLRVLSKLGVAGYQPYERLGLWLRQRLQPFVSALLLSDRSIDRGLFDPVIVRRIIEDHRDGRRNHTFLLMAMLIFEAGQRQFVDEDVSTLWQPV